MPNTRTKEALDFLNKTLVAGAIVGGLALMGLYLWLSGMNFPPNSFQARSQALVLALIPEFIPVALLFVFGYLMLRRVARIRADEERDELGDLLSKRLQEILQAEMSRRTLFGEFYQVPWEELLATNSDVKIIVHYFDTWIHMVTPGLRHLFARGGKVSVILPNPDNASLLNIVLQRFPEHDLESLKRKIQRTFPKLCNIARESGRTGAEVEVM